MDVDFYHLLDGTSDYKVCEKCGRWNWYEWNECECGSTEFSELTRDIVQREIEWRKENLDHFCYECEVPV